MDLENENYDVKMTKENDFPFTCFPLAFLRFHKVWMGIDGSLTAGFCGSEFVLMKVLNSFVKGKIQCSSFGTTHHWIWSNVF